MTFWDKHKKQIQRIVGLALVVSIPFVVMRTPMIRQALADLVTLMREAPLSGIALFLAIETLALSLTTPIWLMSGLAGYAYGFVWGFALAWPGLVVAKTVAFLVGRVFVKKWALARPGETHFWKAVNRAVQKDGFKVVLLMRLAVVLPQNLLTYMLSATSLRLRDFLAGSCLGLVPATIVHAYVGSHVENLAAFVAGESQSRGPGAWITAALGLVLTISALAVISRYARKALDEVLTEGARGSA